MKLIFLERFLSSVSKKGTCTENGYNCLWNEDTEKCCKPKNYRRNDFISNRCTEIYVINLSYFIINSLILDEFSVLKETSAFFCCRQLTNYRQLPFDSKV